MTKALALAFSAWIIVFPVRQTHAIDLNPLSSIKSLVETAAEDRNSSDIAEDLRIKAEITASLVDTMGTDAVSIGIDVYEQDVMLTGAVETGKRKSQAAGLTAAIKGIKKIYNDILVIPPLKKEKGTTEEFVDDTVIETKINALLLDATGVNVTNYRWRSVGGNVFLFGRALSSAENEKATRVAKGIEGVISVTNRAKIRPKK